MAMDYFGPYNQALQGAQDVSNNQLAQAYKLHEFETAQKINKLKYDAAKVAYDTEKRKMDIEERARAAALSAQPTANPNFRGYLDAHTPEALDVAQGRVTPAYNTGAADLAKAQNVQPEMVQPNRQFEYIKALVNEDPTMAAKVFAEFEKAAPNTVSEAQKVADFNKLFGTNYTAVIKPDAGELLDKRLEYQARMQQAQIDAASRRTEQQIEAADRRAERRDAKRGTGGGGGATIKPKPLPPAALKQQEDAVDALSTASNIKVDLAALRGQLERGELQLGPIKNLQSKALNVAGMSSDNSRKFATLNATLQRLRNDSLRLNKGVQTEGDAVRAWQELVDNINDPKLVIARLKEIENINDRAAMIQQIKIDNIRSNYGQGALNTETFANPAPAVGVTTQPKKGARPPLGAIFGGK